MEFKCKLVEKTFNTPDGNSGKYYALVFELFDGSTVDITIKGDKAKLLLLSKKANNVDPDIWSE